MRCVIEARAVVHTVAHVVVVRVGAVAVAPIAAPTITKAVAIGVELRRIVTRRAVISVIANGVVVAIT